MGDPFSAVGSVLAVVGCTAETSKFLFKFLRRIPSLPRDIHQSSEALKSLQVTLLQLQRCGAQLDPKYSFSAQFTQRLHECLQQLTEWAIKIEEIDSKVAKTASISRAWEKTKWLLHGEQEMRSFLKRMRLHQSAFSLELLALLIQFISPKSRSFTSEDANTPQVPLDSAPLFSFSEQRDGHVATSCAQNTLLTWPCFEQSVRARFSIRSSLISCNYVLRLGPVIEYRSIANRRIAAGVRPRRKVGYGFGLAFSLPKRYAKIYLVSLHVLQASTIGSAKFAISWSLDYPRIVPRDSNVFLLAKAGDVEGIKTLFSAGLASPRDTTVFGVTLLHTASRLRNIKLLRFLIQEGSGVNIPDEDGEVPLHGALAFEDNYDTARLLIESGADLANQATDSKTPLHTNFNNTVAQVLLKTDAIEGTVSDYAGMSVTHFIAWSSKSTVMDFQRGRMHDLTDLWAPDNSGRTCLHLAASRGNLKILEYLLERAAPHQVRGTDIGGCPPLHYAVRSTRVTIAVDLILAKGGNILAKDHLSCNILHHAARWNNLEAVEKVLTLRANKILLAEDKHGRMPSHYARGDPLSAVYKYLSQVEPAISPELKHSRAVSLQSSNNDICLKIQDVTPWKGTWLTLWSRFTIHRYVPRIEIGVVLLAGFISFGLVIQMFRQGEE
ncbi:MAG: hypothetical protein Q9171_001799 [Xanthocarpia ochracea]